MEELIEKLKKEIISQLNLSHLTSADIDAESPLFGDGLGLDSIDALELIVLLQQQYKIKLTNADEGRAVFQSVKSMAEYIYSKQK